MDRILAQLPDFFTWKNIALLGESAGLTLAMTLLGCLIGFGLALMLVYLRTTPGLWALPLRVACIAYVEVFRRIPFLVVIYLVLFFIQTVASDVSLFSIAVISICIYAVAYTADIIRGGIESVPKTQIEAAQAMNLSRFQTMRLCVLPQALPVIIPPAIAFAVSFIKDTALVSQIGVFELTFRGKELNNQGYSGVLVFGTIAFCYFLMSFPLSLLGQYLEKRLATPRGQRHSR
ncbi:amino acid ABC transporter permease [Mameliella sediminis]|uniref:amino acid ABC transporter permease n=1 Tax=Mameliella sediminis TaxID=2836866 RepID=UPI001C46C626|nr:amino acid ABC transporter permease [Mameliella sediminis]MBY6146851.1 amino acid ABC transporter permease [Mameliella alba]MBV7397281.1 amino acid ABC transporter permease [Mameliella sediminis]MBY6163824.1 amino acid ABC transporter permease [Mameliella alba]MBY6172235.1 amino acid ABC transporter permease [Mameliella alba]MBY6177311.1 amino acid ABC transporter permease [Mameliella alba]